MVYALIMAGGVGSRFWPKSRSTKPKQFLELIGKKTLIRQTVDRISPIVPPENTFVITNSDYVSLVADELPELPKEHIIGEIVGRNTAPCVALSAALIQARDPDAVMIVLPSDHYIRNDEVYRSVISSAVEKAKKGKNLVTIGIEPHRPETGYGYIQFQDQDYETIGDHQVHLVKTFAEKPDLQTAAHFVESGDFLWNSGMFIWSVNTILDQFQEHLPDMHHEAVGVQDHVGTAKQQDAIDNFYQNCISISIDYGIMEKTDAVHVIPADFGWSDVGSWMAVYELADKDKSGNVIQNEQCINIDSHNCYVEVHDNKLVGLVGVQGLSIVETPDALLICRSDASQDVKKLYEELKTKKLNGYI